MQTKQNKTEIILYLRFENLIFLKTNMTESFCGCYNLSVAVIWLPHSQLWAIVEGTASLTALFSFDLKVTESLVVRLGP